MHRTLTAVMITLVFAMKASAQNACGVKASFTPNNDTTLYTGQAITFTNTSQNADSYEWYNDVNNKTTSTDFTNFVPAVGVTQIMLVAHQGACTDTAITYLVRNGTAPTDIHHLNISYGLPITNEWVQCMTNAKADGYLLAGLSGSTDTNGYNAPYFVTVSEAGCILWSRSMPPALGAYIPSLISTYDSGFVAQVYLKNDRENSYFLKFDKNGNLLWTRSYQGTGSLNWKAIIHEASDHSLMIMNGNFDTHYNLITHLTEQGNFLWQKSYPDDDGIDITRAVAVGMVDKDGYAWVAGTHFNYDTIHANLGYGGENLFKIDLATGGLQWFKEFDGRNKYDSWNGIHFYKDGLIMNAYGDSVMTADSTFGNFEILFETDLNGNLRDQREIQNNLIMEARIGNDLIVNDDNSLLIFYSDRLSYMTQPKDLNFFLKLDPDKNIVWQKTYSSADSDFLLQAVPAPDHGIAMIGQRKSNLLSPKSGFSQNMVLVKIDSNGMAMNPDCFTTNSFTTVQNTQFKPFDVSQPVPVDQSLQVVDQNLRAANPNSEMRYNCPDYVAPCTFMKLSGKSFVCNLKDTLEFIAHRDPSCSDPVIWSYDLANIKTIFQDGGKTRLLFKTPGVYKIRAEKPFPCADIVDSIMVTVAPGLANFTLGNDTTICAADSLILKPDGKYFQYSWQDGSSADSFLVKTTGDYHLTVADSCGNTKSDTIHVDFKTALTVDLGPARLKCKNDSLLITVPGSFQTASWTPAYNLIPASFPGVILFPKTDTTYHLDVSDASGCKGSADLRINIIPSMDANIGNDTSFCFGGHAVFTAAGHFASYAWSNGSTSNSIDVQTTGKYSVIAIDQYGCKTYDTVSLTVYQPTVHISGGIVICKDQTLVLDAGAGFTSYTWQDSSRAQFYNVIDTGFYRVQVSDQHQCVAADSIYIAQFAETPAHFLPADTTVCSYLGAILQPRDDFAQYNWSTGETGKSIQVKTAGEYTLQVVTPEGCKGIDSVHVDLKNCEALLVFPNAFTPNHDGLNDVFHLKYPGHAADYNLQIFNRWGQKIFETSDTSAGWDGTFNSQLQPEGTYVWILRYSDSSGKKQNKKGSVVLIR